MNRREVYLENRRVLADSGEITTPINVRDVITSISIELRATNGASSNKDVTMADCLTSIDLLDGSEVLWSLSGHQLFALTAYNLGRIPYQLITEMPGLTQNLYGVLQFGRWPGDPSYGFDPSKFNNPQLRLKWNLAAVNAVGATGFVSGTGRISYVAEVMEGAPLPVAMLCAKQEYSFTTAASGDETIDLPTDRRIKRVLLRSYEAGVGILSDISRVKLSVDQDKFIPLDMTASDIARMTAIRNGEFFYKHGFYHNDADTIYFVTKLEEVVGIHRDGGDSVIGYANNGIGQGTLSLITGGSADTTDRTLWAHVHGMYPYSVVCLDMGEWDDPASWLETPLYKSLRMILTQSGADGAASIVLETEKIY